MTEAATDGNSRLMNILEGLAGEGRTPVKDFSPEDPRLTIRTPEGVIRISRKPDYVRSEGSSTVRAWQCGKYRLEEDRDGQPGLDVNHAVVVKRRDH